MERKEQKMSPARSLLIGIASFATTVLAILAHHGAAVTASVA